MTGEQSKTLEALRIAIRMEIDGKDCYLEASRQSSNEVGRKLLRSLADEEDQHRKNFEQIYEAIRRKKAWPKIAIESGRDIKLRNEFVGSCQLAGVGIKGGTAEFNDINTAVEKEKQSYDFYRRQGEKARYDAEREFFQALAAEERQHELILLDYYEYLTDPTGWFTRAEHHSLDGG